VELDTSKQYFVGHGGYPNAEGVVECDAAIMDGAGRLGSVGALQVRAVACPICFQIDSIGVTGWWTCAVCSQPHIGSSCSPRAQSALRSRRRWSSQVCSTARIPARYRRSIADTSSSSGMAAMGPECTLSCTWPQARGRRCGGEQARCWSRHYRTLCGYKRWRCCWGVNIRYVDSLARLLNPS